ncbi:unnamed protein product [Ambrosiozyma monospora]|uniref:Unnamed protein product n=1 Tax=Ambrosiozyma monospora TaxID=43982 RepID=A0ACB5TAZ0_AMBMO|nr:unnamed protein product [Ambrosiozyma monospora]
MARVEVYYASYIHGIRFVFEDGHCETVGKVVGNYDAFTFLQGEKILGVKLWCGEKLNAIQFRTTLGRMSNYVGFFCDPNAQEFDLSFNYPLRYVTGFVGSGIECIKFHWL